MAQATPAGANSVSANSASENLTSANLTSESFGQSSRAGFVRVTFDHPEGVIAGWHSPGVADEHGKMSHMQVIFAHATGLCAAAYREGLAHLDPAVSVYALDMRGHGRTQLPIDTPCVQPLKNWQVYADDICVVLQTLSARVSAQTSFVLAGHSMGAVSSALAAVKTQRSLQSSVRPISAVCLLEPVAMHQMINRLAGTPAWGPVRRRFSMVVNAAKRRNHWDDVDSVRASYGKKAFFCTWHKACLDGYLLDGLKVERDGVRLACSPAWEAVTFGAQANRFWPAVKTLAPKLCVVRGALAGSTVPGLAAGRFRRMDISVRDVENAGHMFPMTHPADVGASLNRVLQHAAPNKD